MESNKLKEYITKIDTLDYDHYLLMIKKFGKRETNKFLNEVLKNIRENENLTEEERQFYLDNFDGFINRVEYEKELKEMSKEEENIEDLELLYKEHGDILDSVGMYLKETNSTPLLKPDEEKKYGKDLKLKDNINIFTEKTIPKYESQIIDLETVFSSIKTEQEKNEITTLLNNYTFNIKDNESKEQKIIKYYLYEYEKLYKSLNKIPEVNDLNNYFSSKVNNQLNVFTEFSNQKAIEYSKLNEEVKNYIEYMTARNIFIKSNLKLVISIAKKYANAEIPILDLIQDGNNGLMTAVDRFDVDLGNRFSTYATWWIRQSVTRGIADKARSIRMPVHMVEKYNKLIRTRKKLSQIYGREATLEEVANELDMSLEDTEKLIINGMRITSLDKAIGEEDDSTLGDFVASNEQDIADTIIDQTCAAEIEKALSGLKEREAKVIKLRYGLEDGNPRTLDEVGIIFGLTRERIRQIEAKAMKKLRLRNKELKIYLKK